MKNIHYIGNLKDPGYSSTTVSFIFMMHPGETTEYFQLFQDAVRDPLSSINCSCFHGLIARLVHPNYLSLYSNYQNKA